MGSMLAALDNNYNVGRSQKISIIQSKKKFNVTLKKHFHVAYRKPSKKFIARKVYAKISYQYKKDMMELMRIKAQIGEKIK